MNKCHVCGDAMLKIFRFPIFYVYLCLTMPHATRRLKYCHSISSTSTDIANNIVRLLDNIYSWIKNFFFLYFPASVYSTPKLNGWLFFLIIRMFALIDLYLPFLSCIGQTIQIESFIIGKKRKIVRDKKSIQYALLQSI